MVWLIMYSDIGQMEPIDEDGPDGDEVQDTVGPLPLLSSSHRTPYTFANSPAATSGRGPTLKDEQEIMASGDDLNHMEFRNLNVRQF